jgi:hypothetical protein
MGGSSITCGGGAGGGGGLKSEECFGGLGIRILNALKSYVNEFIPGPLNSILTSLLVGSFFV